METKFERDGVSPGEEVIRNIMSYSRALMVIKTNDRFLFRVMN